MSANSWLLDKFFRVSVTSWNPIALADFPRRLLPCSNTSRPSVIIWTSFNACSLILLIVSCWICLVSLRARALANIMGIGSLLRFSPVRGRISLVTRLACTVLARLKSERFAIFGHVRQTDSQHQFCTQRHVARFYTSVYRAPPFSVVHAHSTRRSRLNLAAAVQNAKVIRVTHDRLSLKTQERLPMHRMHRRHLVFLSSGRHEVDFLLRDLADRSRTWSEPRGIVQIIECQETVRQHLPRYLLVARLNSSNRYKWKFS